MDAGDHVSLADTKPFGGSVVEDFHDSLGPKRLTFLLVEVKVPPSGNFPPGIEGGVAASSGHIRTKIHPDRCVNSPKAAPF